LATSRSIRSPHEPLDARDALIVVLLGAPAGGAPALSTMDRRAFWKRFDVVAPLHLRLAVRGLAFGLVWVYPLMVWPPRPWFQRTLAEQEDVLRRFAGVAGLGAALDLIKVVACFAWFDDDRVQDEFRGRQP
jgi:hypothetical protein